MVPVVLWLCIVSSASVLVGLGVAATGRRRFDAPWYPVFVVVLGLLAASLLVYTRQFVGFVYFSEDGGVGEVVLYVLGVAVSCALGFFVPRLHPGVSGPGSSGRCRSGGGPAECSRERRPAGSAQYTWVGVAAAVLIGVSTVVGPRIEAAMLRRFVLALRYVLPSAGFLWVYVGYRNRFAGTIDTAGVAAVHAGGAGRGVPGASIRFYRRIALYSSIAFAAITADAVLVRFSLAGDHYVPDGVITILVYGVSVGVAVLCHAWKGARAVAVSSVAPSVPGIGDAFVARYGITPREHDIIRCLLDGATNNEIGERLFISPRTVDTHFSNIYRKCGVRGRVDLLMLITRGEAVE